MSEIIDDLLCVQKELVNPKNSAVNPFFSSRYVPLNEVLNLVKPVLNNHNFVLIQNTGVFGDTELKGVPWVITRLLHTSGDSIESDKLGAKPVKNNPQNILASLTYLKRGSLLALLGITNEEDDDGNSISQGVPETSTEEPKKSPKSNGNPKSTKSPKSTAHKQPKSTKNPKSTKSKLEDGTEIEEMKGANPTGKKLNPLLDKIKDACPILYKKASKGVNQDVITEDWLVKLGENLLGENLIDRDQLGLVKEELDC